MGERYEPKAGDTIEDMLLYFEMQRLKYEKALAFIKLIYNRRFITPVTVASWEKDIESAKELLRELEEKE